MDKISMKIPAVKQSKCVGAKEITKRLNVATLERRRGRGLADRR